MLTDCTIAQGILQRAPGRYRIIEQPLGQEAYAAAVSAGNQELLDVIDQVIRTFKDSGAWQSSLERHQQSAPTPPSTTMRALMLNTAQRNAAPAPDNQPLPLARPGSGLRRVQERGCLAVEVREDMPGFGYRDPNTGAFSGLEIDLARAIARRIFADPEKVQFHAVATSRRISMLQSFWAFFSSIRRSVRIFSTILASNWWHLGMAGQLPDFLCPAECVGKQDFVGMDYYWGINHLRLGRLWQLAGVAQRGYAHAPVYPGALYSILRYQARLFPNLPILIIENGSVDVADGIDRPTYLRRHIREVQRAVRDGVKVTAFVCWAISSNREWGLHFDSASDFGLYHIDLDTDPSLTRRPTPAVETYRQIIANRGDGVATPPRPAKPTPIS